MPLKIPGVSAPHSRGVLAAALIGLTLFVLCSAWYWIRYSTNEERGRMLAALGMRATSLAWAVEGGARFMESGHAARKFSELVTEMGWQPGIAWVALVNSDGRIIVDSNAQLQGELLYTPQELADMHPEPYIKGRFSPDDPDIYETWKIFEPARLNHRRTSPTSGVRDRMYIFIGLDVTDFNKDLQDYHFKAILMATLCGGAFMGGIALAFLLYVYRASRRTLEYLMALANEVLGSYPWPIFVANTAGEIILANPQARKLLAMPRPFPTLGRLSGLDWQGLINGLGPGEVIRDREYTLMPISGQRIPVSVSASRIETGGGEAHGYMVALRQLPVANLLKQKAQEAKRVAEMSNLAAGLAHEIRNPLSSICGYARLLAQKVSHEPLAAATANLLVEEAQRLNNVLSDLLSVARPPTLNRRREKIGPILQKACRLLLPDAEAKKITFTMQLTEKEDLYPPACVDSQRLLQVILNLLLNAIQAIPAEGNIVVGLSFEAAGTVPAELGVETGFWKVTVQDNGPGMPENVLRQIFTPYFTTKASGTGLGLPLAKQIAEAHEGALYVESLPGAGAKFILYLPECQ